MKRPPEMLNQKKRGIWDSVSVIICAILLAFLFLNLKFNREFFLVTVEGPSMMDTLHDGDVFYASAVERPERLDIVIIDVSGYESFQSVTPNADGRRIIIKRLIALEGDCVKCEDGVIYLKKAGEMEFSRQEEPFVSSAYRTPNFGEIAVGEGEMFVLGDHRNNSHDSEDAGCLKLQDVIGVVLQSQLGREKPLGFFGRLSLLFD